MFHLLSNERRESMGAQARTTRAKRSDSFQEAPSFSAAKLWVSDRICKSVLYRVATNFELVEHPTAIHYSFHNFIASLTCNSVELAKTASNQARPPAANGNTLPRLVKITVFARRIAAECEAAGAAEHIPPMRPAHAPCLGAPPSGATHFGWLQVEANSTIKQVNLFKI